MDVSNDAGFRFKNLSVYQCLIKGEEVQNKNTINYEKNRVVKVSPSGSHLAPARFQGPSPPEAPVHSSLLPRPEAF